MIKRIGPGIIIICAFLFINGGLLFAAAEPVEDKASQFTAEISALAYHPVDYTDQALDLSWDFSKEETYPFKFDQTIYVLSDLGMKPESGELDRTVNTVAGEMLIKSLGDGYARMVFQNMETTMEIQTPEGPETMTQKMPVNVVGKMTEKSRDAGPGGQKDMAMRDIFPLPTEPIRLGETLVQPVTMPFNAMGSMLYAKGEERITLTGFVARDSRLCAQLDVVQEISDLDVPPEIEGEYYFRKVLTGRAFFDIHRKRFVEVVVAGRVIIDAKATGPDFSSSSDKNRLGNKFPNKINMFMDSDNLVTVLAK